MYYMIIILSVWQDIPTFIVGQYHTTIITM